MDIRGLTIGNYVNILTEISGAKVKSSIILKIGSIDKFGKIKIIEPDKPTIEFNFGEYSPIKLNENWLFKFGFIFDKINSGKDLEQNSYYIENPHFIRINFDYNTKRFFLFVNNEYRIGREFDYVHELQNLCFALSGVELVCA